MTLLYDWVNAAAYREDGAGSTAIRRPIRAEPLLPRHRTGRRSASDHPRNGRALERLEPDGGGVVQQADGTYAWVKVTGDGDD